MIEAMTRTAPSQTEAKPARTESLPGISCVVIGKNEGPFLDRCLKSIREADYPADRLEILYVDSASDDDSVVTAQKYADRVVVVRLTRPLPGLARNLGWKRARHDLIHFIDGDTEVDRHWFQHAVKAMEEPGVFCVFGRLEEMRPEANLYHRAYNFEWETPVPGITEVRTSGGIVLVRKEMIEALGGFDKSLEAGEEPDLCTRARLRGLKLRYLDRPMAHHDMDMNTFRSYWRRGVRCGYAYAEIGMRFRKTSIPLWKSEVVRNLGQLLALSLAFSIAASMAGPLIALAAIPAGFLLLVLRKAWLVKSSNRGGASILAYAVHVYLVKVPPWLGHLRYFLGRKPDAAEATVLSEWEREG